MRSCDNCNFPLCFPKMKKNNPYIEKLREYPQLIKGRWDILSHSQIHYYNYLQGNFPMLILEIGSGSGNHLIGLAERYPQAKVMGLEIRYKRIFRTAQKAVNQGIENIAVLQWDGNLFHTLARPGSIDQIYLNFPDPWAKKKYQNRRIFLGDFISRIHDCLVPGGFFYLKTDHGEYFEHFLESLDEYIHSPQNRHYPLSLEEVTRDLYNSPWIDDNIQTEFEALFIYKVKETIKHFKLMKGL